MTNQEAIEILNNVFQDYRTQEPIATAVFLGIRALEKVEDNQPNPCDDCEDWLLFGDYHCYHNCEYYKKLQSEK